MTNSDLEKNFKQIELMSEQGDAYAQNLLGVCHLMGIAGLPENAVKANALFALSAVKGFAKAQYNLGVSYIQGRGVQKNEEAGIEWMRKAAAQENCAALRYLAVSYLDGIGVQKDEKKAIELLTRAAKHNDSASQFELGRWYENGWAVRKDCLKACGWYEKAAKQGNEDAKAAMEQLVKNGDVFEFSFSTRQKIKGKWYTRVIPFGDNFIVRSKGLWGIVDGQNNVKLPVKYTRVHWFAGGYAGLQDGNKWGLVDTNGNITIKPQYDSIRYLRQNRACEAEKDGRRLVVAPDGSIPFKARGKNCRFEGDKIFVWTKGACRLCNTDGTPFGGPHELICAEEDYYIGYDEDDKSHRNWQTLIKSNGEEIRLPLCEISIFRNHIAKFRHNNKYGIIDDNGNIVVPNQYDFISLEYDGIIAINVGNQSKDYDSYFYADPDEGKWILWNSQYQAITPYYYDDLTSIDVDGDSITIAQRDGHWYSVTPNGETLFAKDDKEMKAKREANGKQDAIEDPEEGQFEIFGDSAYKKDGYKFYVRACDGKYIRHYYYTPYLAKPVTGLNLHWKIADSFVNVYGQDMPDIHPFRINLPKKPRRIFRLVPKYSRLSNKDMISLFVGLMKILGVTEKREVISVYSIFQTGTRRAVACDWIIRKLRRNKNFKMNMHELASMSVDIEYWLRRKGIDDKK